jgi:hypothetical protein
MFSLTDFLRTCPYSRSEPVEPFDPDDEDADVVSAVALFGALRAQLPEISAVSDPFA